MSATQQEAPSSLNTEELDQTFGTVNRTLRVRYLELAAELAHAQAINDQAAVNAIAAAQQEVMDALAATNGGWVTALARRWFPVEGPADDYLQAGWVGLLKAFHRWDPEQAPLASYSMRFINAAIRDAVIAVEHQGQSSTSFNSRPAILAATEQLSTQLGRTPSHAEVAAHCGHTPEMVARVRATKAVSLQAPIGETANLGDLIADIPSDPVSNLDLDLSTIVSMADLLTSTESMDTVLSNADPEAFKALTCDLGARELFVMINLCSQSGSPTTVRDLAARTGVSHETLRKAANSARGKTLARLQNLATDTHCNAMQ